ncbi:hypothetical protein M1L60_39975 [Actinoplanes sp. TRM 88003]|uniref:Uncharacterized protein n=1 Tax=Paractinoplanes aksuensis TaxID=2939490 RepID=A0ABT1E4P6_9ACTN|nr:hypothetical protein [Actinoplanes aksuensis]MCO8276776.1 hypothetical protein [Actinoplanes aksuensis]
MEIEIVSATMRPAALRAALEAEVPGVPFAERPPRYRAVDTAVVVALVSGGASAFAALISGAFSLAVARRAAQRPLVIRGRSASIEVPPDTPPEDIAKLVELARGLDEPVLELP